jgi:hypothetical protein
VLDAQGVVPEAYIPDVTSTRIVDSTVVGRKVITAVDAPEARAAINIDGQVIGTADALPNECGFWWVSEPVAVDGKVYMGTVAADRGSWVQEWTQTDPDGPFYLNRYFMGYPELTFFQGVSDLRDDHNAAQFAVKAGKPLVVFWSPHTANARFYYRISDQNVDEVGPGELTFGPVKAHDVGGDQRTAYTQVMHDGDDIWVAHRTGYNPNKWSLTKFPDWGTGTPLQHDVVVTAPSGGQPNQLYVKARMVDGVIRCMVANGPTASVHNKVWWFEVDTDSGDVTQADGTVLGNLDGTNLPLEASTELEVVYSPSGGQGSYLFDVADGATRQMTFLEATISNFMPTATYKHARWTGSAWSVNTISTVNQPTGQVTYYPIANFVPGESNSVILTRAEPSSSTAGVHYVEKWTTANNGSTWTKAEVVDSASYNSAGAGDRLALARAFPVRVESGTALFDVIASEIIKWTNYYSGWVIRTRPLPLSIPVKRVPQADPIREGRRTEPQPPLNGLYLPGLTGHYIQGPTSSSTLPSVGVRVEIDVALPDWTPASEITLIGKEKNNSTREFRLIINSLGRVGVYWSENGSTFKTLQPNDVPSPPFEPWQRVKLAVEFIPEHAHPTNPSLDQYSFRSYYRLSDDKPWTVLNQTQTTTATSLFVSDSPWEIGGRQAATSAQAAGVYYRAAVMSLGGEVLAEWRADRSSDQGIQVDPQGNTWTVKSRDLALTNPVVTGRVLINGVQAETKGHTHAAADVVGARSWVAAPATSTSPGTVGQEAYDANGFYYLCVAPSQWRRVQLTTF